MATVLEIRTLIVITSEVFLDGLRRVVSSTLRLELASSSHLSGGLVWNEGA